jgi:hypothetical protein
VNSLLRIEVYLSSDDLKGCLVDAETYVAVKAHQADNLG